MVIMIIFPQPVIRNVNKNGATNLVNFAIAMSGLYFEDDGNQNKSTINMHQITHPAMKRTRDIDK